MEREIYVFGNAEVHPDYGFPTEASFERYIGGDIFTEYRGRYRNTNRIKKVDIIVLSRQGKAYGHFEIEDVVTTPDERDKKEYPKVKYVYLVRSSALYGT